MVEFSLGAMSPPIGQQIPGMDGREAERLQSHVEAVFLLLLAGYITKTQKNKILDAIAKNVQKALTS